MRTTLRRLAVLATAALAATFPGIAAAPAASAATLPAPQPGAEVYLRPSSGAFTVVGGGFGHGIGMSQYGAQGAATKGLAYGKILAFYYPGTSLVAQAPATIRVGITVDNDGVVRVAARPGLAITIGSTTTTLPSTPSQWRVRATGTTASTCVVESYNGSTWSTYAAGRTPCPVTFSNPADQSVDLYLPSGTRRVYRGRIIAHHRGTTSLATVNSLPMQDYLRSVVPSEMPSSWRLDALKSQAVAARTYASRRAGGTSYYDTCDTTSCQVYRGRGTRNSDGTITSYEAASTNTAVDDTKGQVLTYPFSSGTGLATTMYSSSNGGEIAPGPAGHGYLKAKADPYDGAYATGRPHAWTASLPVASLESRYGIARVERVQILRRDGYGQWGGRVLSVRVEGVTSSGAYVYKDTTGNGIMAARSWPSYSDGLSSNYFTIRSSAAVTRIAGPDRYATAAEVSRAFSSGVAVVYVANGQEFPDAVVGAARAGLNHAPLLLTQAASIPQATRDAMTRLRPGRVVVLGSTSVVSDAVARALQGMTTTGNLQRVGGTDRYDTAARLAGYYPTGAKVAYVATGENFPDALAGAALAGRDQAPLLLTAKWSLPTTTASALARLRPARIVVFGSTGAVSQTVASQLARYATTGSVTRLQGSDLYATAAAIAQQFPSATTVYLASGQTYPDALAGAALAGGTGAPLLLTRADQLPDATRAQLARLRPRNVRVLGGAGVVSDTVLAQVRAATS